MTLNSAVIKKVIMPSKQQSGGNVTEAVMLETMSNPNYLRQSSSLINDALQKGFDVLQMADGDIVMTGVKTVVYQYTWDDKKSALVRTKASAAKHAPSPHHPRVNLEELDSEDETELADMSAQ
jgi:hypothetical protein